MPKLGALTGAISAVSSPSTVVLRFFVSELMRETTVDPWARSTQSAASRSPRRSISTGPIPIGVRLK